MERAELDIKYPIHKSVMVREVTRFLRPHSDGIYVDATLGLGGHAEAILQCPGTKVIAFDIDDEVISFSKNRLSRFETRIKFSNTNFSQIDKALESLSIEKVDGIVADLGMSSFQLEASGRGFSFQMDEKLDMRMDLKLRFTAHDLVNEMDEEEISKVLKNYGEERWAKRIAREISKSRSKKPIETTHVLANIVSKAVPKRFYPLLRHPATRTFQALRIAVNNELESLEVFLEKAPLFLKSGGRIVIISFHSLEDRLVKNAFKRLTSACICPKEMPRCGCGRKNILNNLTRTPLTPSLEEINENPKSRSAKLRGGEKI
ncbi:MAG: 16S rRNA (cytosine(1402)-N(4))-methyltransferase RsmH [Candidatus Dadabacteria bacterium]|nr:16S rRNA (cytosine(1402)-N(4))-methyltransferase RsmH [Candidatus Dadabacteria bacterium]